MDEIRLDIERKSGRFFCQVHDWMGMAGHHLPAKRFDLGEVDDPGRIKGAILDEFYDHTKHWLFVEVTIPR